MLVGKFTFHLLKKKKKCIFRSLSPTLKITWEWPCWVFHPVSCYKARTERTEVFSGYVVWWSVYWQPEDVSSSLPCSQAELWAEGGVGTNVRLSPISHSLSSFFSRWKIVTENVAAISWEVRQTSPMPPWETEGKKMGVPVHPSPSTSNSQMRET